MHVRCVMFHGSHQFGVHVIDKFGLFHSVHAQEMEFTVLGKNKITSAFNQIHFSFNCVHNFYDTACRKLKTTKKNIPELGYFQSGQNGPLNEMKRRHTIHRYTSHCNALTRAGVSLSANYCHSVLTSGLACIQQNTNYFHQLPSTSVG